MFFFNFRLSLNTLHIHFSDWERMWPEAHCLVHVFQASLATMPDSSRHRSSISPPRNRVAFYFAKQVSVEHSISSPSILLLREGKKNILTNDRQMTRQKVSPQFVVDRSSICPDRNRSQRCSASTASSRACCVHTCPVGEMYLTRTTL